MTRGGEGVKFFLQILKSFDSHQVHSMLAQCWILISNPHGLLITMWGVKMQSIS